MDSDNELRSHKVFVLCHFNNAPNNLTSLKLDSISFCNDIDLASVPLSLFLSYFH
jgi:hypothetical protein